MIDARRFVYISTTLCFLGTAILLKEAHLSLGFNHLPVNLPLLVAASFLPVAVYRSEGIAWLDRIVCGFECLGLFVTIVLIGATASYAMAALSSGWIDDSLIYGDQLIGLDWLGYWNLVQSHPLLNDILSTAYKSISASPSLIIAALAAAGHFDRLYRFLAAYLICLFLADISLVYFPATSAAAHYLPHNAPNMPLAGSSHIAVIEGLRIGTLKTVQVADMIGLITVPSFHAICCILYVWATWNLGKLRHVFLATNGAMLLSTPIHGGHYFSDIAIGIIVAVLAIMACKYFTISRMTSRRRKANKVPTPEGRPSFI
ncbi:phosphatase PAP2 family protein [Novosphingobium terrae]|uniref:phosphatase PAP2 family protein n=1 Tax=Novosphingobium terrae TaxID=2726189 RepID=UPI00197D1FD4|nr:phosphatase PAP2 family protein [Novosphingobium terrae]